MAGEIDPRVQRDLDAAEERLRREAEEQEREARMKYVRRCYLEIFSLPKGKVVLEDLRSQFYDVDGFVPGNPYDSHALACTRNVVLRIITIVKEEQGVPKDPQAEAET